MAAGIQPCSNDDCRYPTRPSRWAADEHPMTRQRRPGGLCHTCYDIARPRRKNAVEGDPPKPETVAALNTFLAGRRAREQAAFRRQYPHLYRKDTA